MQILEYNCHFQSSNEDGEWNKKRKPLKAMNVIALDIATLDLEELV